MGVLEYGTLAASIISGNWWLFGVGMGITVILSIILSAYYYKSIDYICPECNHIFKPAFKKAFFANHTPTTRKLTCPACGIKSFCVETAAEEK